MKTLRIPPRVKRFFSRMSSLLLLFQRTPVVQMLFPEANLLGGAAAANSAAVAVTAVVGLGAYDSVAGATTMDEVAPLAVTGATTSRTSAANAINVPATVSAALNFEFQCENAPSDPKSWRIVDSSLNPTTLPAGLVMTRTNTVPVNVLNNFITGTPAQAGTYPVYIRVYESGEYKDKSMTQLFNICVLGFSTQPAATTTISSGGSTTLSCVATGIPVATTRHPATPTVTYQWYQGASGTMTTPVGTTNSSTPQFTTPALSSTTSYWVRIRSVLVTGTSTSTVYANSNTAVVNVTATPAAIATHPASTTINSGSTTVLSVVASGTAPFTYQWYQGAAGTTTTPVGTNSNSFTTPALSSTTSYWVKVSNAANLAGANSNTATVTVNQPAAVATHPASTTINSGSTTVLSVVASGTAPFTYQWYQGAVGATTTPVGTNSDSFTTPALSSTTSYWVKVSNAANPGGASSNVATVTVRSAFEAWALGLPAGQNAPGDAPRGDGVTNLVKFGFNLDPLKADVRHYSGLAGDNFGLPVFSRPGGVLRVDFVRRKSTTNPGIAYVVEFSSSLSGGWTDFSGAGTPTSIDSIWERVSVNDSPPPNGGSRYGRVRVIQAP